LKRQATYAPTSKHAQDLTAALSYYIAKDMTPFHIVERPGFLRLMKVAVPHCKVSAAHFIFYFLFDLLTEGCVHLNLH
jgi:hypothetical protein